MKWKKWEKIAQREKLSQIKRNWNYWSVWNSCRAVCVVRDIEYEKDEYVLALLELPYLLTTYHTIYTYYYYYN